MNAMSKSSKGSGCGCGGGCGGSSGGCGCGGGQTSAAQCVSGDVGCATGGGQGYSRPHFFAGQLLTEEDLQALGDYVIGKNRLHNRHLFGDGVVCGLEVTCNPCGGGTVVVQPGYALDCCGNDLLLSCPTELDVNAMARDLRRNLLGGYDCGDPCADKKKKPEQKPPAETPAPAPTGANMMATPDRTQPAGQTIEPRQPDRLRHYCLYALYCEEKTDPVSPYATDDGCAFQSCQPTRVREGVGFELRCRSCECRGEDILTRLCGCLGNVEVTRESTRNTDALATFVRLNTQRNQSYKATTLTSDDASRALSNLAKSRESLRSLFVVAAQPSAATTTARVATQPAETAQPSAEDKSVAVEKPAASASAALGGVELERSVLEIRDAATHLAAFYAASQSAATPSAGANSAEELAVAKRELLRATAEARAAIKATPASALEHAYYASILVGAERLAKSERPEVEIGARSLRAMSLGINMDAQTKAMTLQRVQALREALLDALDASPRISDCRLRSDVRAVSLPASEQGSDEELLAAARALTDAWERYQLDCVCASFNPPCSTCDDTGVLLACLVVDEATCEVVEICNIKRKFVISPTALRYWLPPLNLLGDLLEKLCCDEPLCEDEDTVEDRPSQDMTSIVSRLFRFDPSVQRDIRSALLKFVNRLCNPEPERRPSEGTVTPAPQPGFAPNNVGDVTRANIISSIRAAFVTPPAEAARTAVAFAPAPTRSPAEIVGEAMKDPATRAALLRVFEQETGKSAPTREELTADIEREVKARIESAAAAPQDEAAIERKVEERLAAALSKERMSASVVEALRGEPVTKLIGELVEGLSAPDTAGGGATADAAVAAAIEKLKLTDVAKDLRELRRVKTENADLKKNLSALETRLKKLEGRT